MGRSQLGTPAGACQSGTSVPVDPASCWPPPESPGYTSAQSSPRQYRQNLQTKMDVQQVWSQIMLKCQLRRMNAEKQKSRFIVQMLIIVISISHHKASTRVSHTEFLLACSPSLVCLLALTQKDIDISFTSWDF